MNANTIVPTVSKLTSTTVQVSDTVSKAQGIIDIICKYNGFFLSFALAVGAMSVGYQPIAGIIFLASLVMLLSISLLTMSSNFDIDDYNSGLSSYTFLYILFSSIYTNGVTTKSFEFVSVILSAISLIINIIYITITYPNTLQRYFIIYIIYGLIGISTSWFVCNLNPNFSLLNTNQISPDNSKCNINPSSTFKCSFISNEDGTEINLEDMLS
jgi:hypothetical protein